ncbi:hypothetical protein Moror_13223 [Moniliophthora roreri MCA 2997]|uniref:F-box domain-containing protein n=2 Tax=Moniliophthora roreri TaxID=221103 RepID=V2X821_MONRO|nr:hypothetical protein Moror_13223 [Moniliophthora roreri MCA 2997]KAI3603347.1 hypothetical protein WG66_002274 [Moniliophthora roreri]
MAKKKTFIKPYTQLDIPQLPQEIISEIIKWNAELGNNELYAYSLVSKAWLASARRFLFRSAQFCGTDSFRTWERLFKSSPEISTFIRTVWVTPSSVYNWEDVGLRLLPGVTEIEWLSGISQSATRATESIREFLRRFPNVKRVCVGAQFEDVQHLKAFLGYCGPGIKELLLEDELRFVHTTTPSPDAPLAIDISRFNLADLEYLDIWSRGGSDFDWVYRELIHGRAPNLRSLKVANQGVSLPVLCLLLKEVSPMLTHLNIGPGTLAWKSKGGYTNLRPLPSPDPFPLLPKLRVLTIDTIFLNHGPMEVLNWIASDFLAVFQAPLLTTFEICFFARSPHETIDISECYYWKPLLTAITGKFAFLSELTICFWMEMEFGWKWRAKLEALVQRYVYSPSVLGTRTVRVKWEIDDPDQAPYPEDPTSEGE